MANQGYLTYNSPSISELFGGMKTPSWLSEGVQYKPFEYQLAVADQMDKMAKAQAERDRQDREAQAELERKDKARAQIQGDLQGLDLSQADPREILTKVQQGLFDAGLIDQGINATRGLIRETKPQQPKVQKVGDALVQIDPDGNVREIYKNEKPAKSDRPAKESLFINGQGEHKKVSGIDEEIQARRDGFVPVKGAKKPSAEEELQAELGTNPQKGAADNSGSSTMADIGAWLSGLYNQPTVNPRSTNSPAVDQGSLVTGDGTRRVFTVRRKAIEQ